MPEDQEPKPAMETIKQIVSRSLSQIRERPTDSGERDLPEPLKKLWIDTLKPFETLKDRYLSEMVDLASDFLCEVVAKRPPRWLSFLGPSGTGKTMLARILYRFIKEHCLHFSPGYGITLTELCHYASWPRMVQDMKNGDFGTVENLCEKEIKWNHVKACTYAYAVVDDIGQVEDSSKAYLISSLGRIAECRMREWTVWTANVSLEEIGEKLDRRIASRMIRDGNVVVELPPDFPDYNLR